MAHLDMSAAQDLPHPKLEALVEMMFLAAAADGEFSDVEKKHFRQSVRSLTDGRITEQELETLTIEMAKRLQNEGREKRLGDVRKRLPEGDARRVALGLAIQITAADGIIRTSERELILQTAEALDIDRDQAADLVAELAPTS